MAFYIILQPEFSVYVRVSRDIVHTRFDFHDARFHVKSPTRLLKERQQCLTRMQPLLSQCPRSNKVRVKCSQIRLDKMVIAPAAATATGVHSDVRKGGTGRGGKRKSDDRSLFADRSFR